MAHGYAGKLPFVDLTSGTIREEVPDEGFYRAWIGGIGLTDTMIDVLKKY